MNRMLVSSIKVYTHVALVCECTEVSFESVSNANIVDKKGHIAASGYLEDSLERSLVAIW